MSRTAFAFAALLALTSPALSAPEPEDPKKQTPSGLYLTAQEAFEMKQELKDQVLFIDVREPIEMMFAGFTDVVDVNVPFLLVNPTKWNAKKPVFAMEPNPGFAEGVLAALESAGLDTSAPVILMCRSGGTRGAPSAKALESYGFEKVYVVVDGFEGSKTDGDPNGPWRRTNGWKNSGLPWGWDLNPEKVYLRSQSDP